MSKIKKNVPNPFSKNVNSFNNGTEKREPEKYPFIHKGNGTNTHVFMQGIIDMAYLYPSQNCSRRSLFLLHWNPPSPSRSVNMYFRYRFRIPKWQIKKIYMIANDQISKKMRPKNEWRKTTPLDPPQRSKGSYSWVCRLQCCSLQVGTKGQLQKPMHEHIYIMVQAPNLCECVCVCERVG